MASALMLLPVFLDIHTHPWRVAPRFHLADMTALLGRHPAAFALFALLEALVLPLRAWQWSLFLPEGSASARTRYRAVALGALAQNILPARAGEVVRALSLSRDSELGRTHTLGTVGLSKLAELAGLLTIVALGLRAVPLGSFDHAMRLALCIGAAVLVGAVATGVWLVRSGKVFGLHGHRWGGWIAKLLEPARELATSRGSRSGWERLLLGYLASVGVVGLSALGLAVAMSGISEPLSLGRGAVLLGAICLGMSIPSAPSGVGVYHLACMATLAVLGVDPLRAAAFAVVTHLLSVVTHSSLGLWELVTAPPLSPAAVASPQSVPSLSSTVR